MSAVSSNPVSRLQTVKFRPGDILFREGETSYHFYILRSGQVEVYRMQPDGQKLHLAELGEGTSVGEFAYLDRKSRSATVMALTEVEAVFVSEEAYQELIEELPPWAVALLTGLVERLRTTNRIVRELTTLEKAKSTELEASTEFGADGVFDLSEAFKALE